VHLRVLGSDRDPGCLTRRGGGREAAGTDSIEPLEWWVDSLELRLLRLQEGHLPGGFDLDFSLDSLVALEAVLSSHFRDGNGLLTVDGGDVVACAAGYIGETLLRLAGGAWDWDNDHPVIRPDQETGLAPVVPAYLVVDCLRARTGHVLRAVHQAGPTFHI
jgi:hypothetical protein